MRGNETQYRETSVSTIIWVARQTLTVIAKYLRSHMAPLSQSATIETISVYLIYHTCVHQQELDIYLEQASTALRVSYPSYPDYSICLCSRIHCCRKLSQCTESRRYSLPQCALMLRHSTILVDFSTTWVGCVAAFPKKARPTADCLESDEPHDNTSSLSTKPRTCCCESSVA